MMQDSRVPTLLVTNVGQGARFYEYLLLEIRVFKYAVWTGSRIQTTHSKTSRFRIDPIPGPIAPDPFLGQNDPETGLKN